MSTKKLSSFEKLTAFFGKKEEVVVPPTFLTPNGELNRQLKKKTVELEAEVRVHQDKAKQDKLDALEAAELLPKFYEAKSNLDEAKQYASMTQKIADHMAILVEAALEGEEDVELDYPSVEQLTDLFTDDSTDL